jgi:predicted lipase
MLNSIGVGGVTGFLALDTTNQQIVLSFRGSRTLENWIDDLAVLPTSISNICSGCDAHLGFWESWQSVSDTITPHINTAVAQYPSYNLVITGHSLGAALATIAATALRVAGHKIDLVSTAHVLADTILREESLIR